MKDIKDKFEKEEQERLTYSKLGISAQRCRYAWYFLLCIKKKMESIKREIVKIDLPNYNAGR
jgi:hypothetical protein